MSDRGILLECVAAGSVTQEGLGSEARCHFQSMTQLSGRRGGIIGNRVYLIGFNAISFKELGKDGLRREEK